MSTRSELLAAFGPRVQIRDENPVQDGSAERLSLKKIPGKDLQTVQAARSLIRRKLPPKVAHSTMSELFDFGEAYIEVPCVESLSALIDELKAAGVLAHVHGPAELSVREVRERLNLSQSAFALRFGLEEATVKNWEQGKSKLNATAKTLLGTIHFYPEAVLNALGKDGLETKEISMPVVSATGSGLTRRLSQRD